MLHRMYVHVYRFVHNFYMIYGAINLFCLSSFPQSFLRVSYHPSPAPEGFVKTTSEDLMSDCQS